MFLLDGARVSAASLASGIGLDSDGVSDVRDAMPCSTSADRSAYVSEDWFRREQEHLFPHAWIFAGMAEDLKEPGDYHCIEAGRASLILLRDQRGELRTFHNTCRHRGTRLLEGRGNIERRIVCFYHSWTYDLAGHLIGVTYERDQFSHIDKSATASIRRRSERGEISSS